MFPKRKFDSTGVKSHWAPMVCFLTLWLHCETQIHSKNYSEFQDKNCKLIKPQSLGLLLSIGHCSGFWALYTAHCSSLHFSLWSKTDQNHLRQKRFYLNHRIKSIIGKGRSRNLKAGNVAETMQECCFLACFPLTGCLLLSYASSTVQAHSPKDGTTQCSLTLPTSISSQESLLGSQHVNLLEISS